LYALALESANDAANGIAELIGGSMDDFAAMLTARAAALGALNTNFTNAHGLDERLHFTSAYDMALITAEAIKDPRFCKIFSAWQYRIPPTNIQPLARILRSPNEILAVGRFDYNGLIATKHGWTHGASYTLATAAERNGRTLVAVVMMSTWENAKWLDTTALFDWGFANFQEVVVEADEILAHIDGFNLLEDDNSELEYTLVAERDFTCLIPTTASPQDLLIEYTPIAFSDGLPEAKALFYLLFPQTTVEPHYLGEMNLRVIPVGEEPTELVHAIALSDDSSTITEERPEEPPLPVITVILWRIAAVCGILIVVLLFAVVIRNAGNRARY